LLSSELEPAALARLFAFFDVREIAAPGSYAWSSTEIDWTAF
jgi:hypothetical protein